MNLKKNLILKSKKFTLPKFWQVNRQKIAWASLFSLILIYFFILTLIRSQYGENLFTFLYNQKLNTDNLILENDSGLSTDNTTDSDNTLASLDISPSSIYSITSSPTATSTVIPTTKPTTKPTAKPTTKPNTPTPLPSPTPSSVIDYSRPWAVGPGCPTTTQNCVPCTSGSTCRFEPNKTHGFIGWSCQNNNPGNIRNSSTNMATDFKNLMIIRNGGTPACGVRYDVRGSSYFVFATYSAGMSGLKAYIKGINNGEHSSYTGCGDCTLQFFFSIYSPGDGSYDDAVAVYIGEPVTQTLRYVVANKLDAFAEAIKQHEGFFTQ